MSAGGANTKTKALQLGETGGALQASLAAAPLGLRAFQLASCALTSGEHFFSTHLVFKGGV